jgi:hypothetical protein
METIYISTTYKLILKWQFKNYPHYKITDDKKIINTKTNRFLKKSVNCCSIGYWIGKKFIPLNKINNHVQKIKYEYCPF